MVPGKATSAPAASRSRHGRSAGDARDAGRFERVGARVRWWRIVLLRRREQWNGEGRPSTPAGRVIRIESARTRALSFLVLMCTTQFVRYVIG